MLKMTGEKRVMQIKKKRIRNSVGKEWLEKQRWKYEKEYETANACVMGGPL